MGTIEISRDDLRWAEGVWDKIQVKIEAECRRLGGTIPYIAVNGVYQDQMENNPYWWTNGFWPGILWQMYSKTADPLYLDAARRAEERLDSSLAGFEGLHHDVGFMWQLSAVADYKLTGNERSRIRGLHAATLLAGRYNPRGRFIRAWNKEFTGRMIVDCMMNLSILYWAERELCDPRFRWIAMDHADTCMEHIVRPDGSCSHMVDFDPETGAVLALPGGQGYGEGSSWTRGQAWALYGFAISFQRTGEPRYLDTAKRVANYFLANVRLTGFIPPVDFRMPPQPEKYDTTAGMIAACGLLELSKAVDRMEQAVYRDGALDILKAILEKHGDWDPDRDGIVQYGSAEYHKKTESHVPIIYGDYFMIEAVLKLMGSEFTAW